jgi:hypothetical protein
MGSSYCKNLTFEGCRLTRFDAHAGIYNVSIRNSELIHITVVGGGTLKVENSTIFNNAFIQLRTDYGNFWHGDVILKNNKMIVGSNTSANILTATWYNHYFGYPTALPENMIIDGFEIYKHSSGTASSATVNLFSDSIITNSNNIIKDYFNVTDDNGNLIAVNPNFNRMTASERVVIRNSKVNIAIPDKATYSWFENTCFEVDSSKVCAEHFDMNGDLVCDDCGKDFAPCTSHSDVNKNGICAFCHADVEIPCSKHTDTDTDEICDVCHSNYVCSGHTDANLDHICDLCGGALRCIGKHADANEDAYCDVCKKKLS